MKFKSAARQFCIFLFINCFIAASYSQAPNQPVNPVPANQAGSVSINPNVCATVSDPNGGTLQVRYYGRQVPANGAEKFTIILLPDTQYYTEEPQGNHQGGIAAMFNAQTTWIANNRQSMNIVYVGQLGDCTQNGDDPPGADNDIEWQRVNTAISTIESPALTGLPQGIPYGLSVGNHDQSPGGGGNTAATVKYNQYFGPSRFNGRSYYGGHQGNDITNNDNHYQLFSASGIDFLIISMEYDTSPETDVLNWAANLVQTYSNRKVIVMTHFGINETGSPKPTFGTQGQAIYDKLKQYPNFMLFVCGHIHQVDGEAQRTDIYNGNTVHTILSDYQERPGGGNGLLRIMEFDPAQNKISVKTYSPYANTYETDADSQFDLSFNMLPVIGQVNNVASGANPCFTWNNLLYNTGYEWGMELYDGQNITTGPVWKFTTAAADLVPPTVSSVTPVNGTTGLSVNTTASAIFNEAMDAATINNSTIELRNPSNALITATVSYNATTRTVTLTPSAALANLTIYTAKIISGSAGVKDAAGNPLASDYSWSFTTVAGDITPPTVSSVTPVNGTTGVSVNTTASAIFNEAMDAATINNSTIELRNPSTALITATVSYNATTRTVTLTPSAALANSTIYTAKVISGSAGVKDAAGNPLASDYSWSFTTVAGDITPPTVSSVSPVNGTTGVSVSTTASAIFNEAMNPGTINNSTIELRNPSNALITATVSYNATTRTATLTPSAALANSTIYTAKVISGSAGVKDAAGNPLATDYSWSFTTVAGDITPPTVSSVSPVNGTTGVSVSTTVSAIFNEAMDATTINSSTIELRNPSNALITTTVSYNAGTRTATLTPSAALANSTIYTAKVISGSSGVKDAAGNPLASDYSWSFTTVAGDITPPTVSSVTPVNGTTGVSVSTTVSAIFNEAMNPGTINSSTIELRNPSNALITATVSYNATTRTATLTPSAALANSTIYTAKVISGSSGVKDAAGNALASDYSWLFTTVAAPSQPPVSIQNFTTKTGTAATAHSLTGVEAGALLVLATTSDAVTSNCSVSSSPSLTWTKRIDAGATRSDNAEIWTAVYSAGGSITVTSNWGAVSQASVCYVVLNAESSLGGTSGTAVSQSAPSVTITTARNNSIIFGCTADWNAVNGTTRTLRDAATERLYFKDVNFTTYYYTKSAASIAAYTEGVSLPTGQQASTALLEIRSAAGAADIVPPTVSSVTPANGATGISVSTTVSAIFNEAMDASTINSSTIELRNPSNVLITAIISYNAGTRTATLTPSAALANSTIYTAKIISGYSGVKDAAGNALASDYSWSFTTIVPDIVPPTVSSVTPVNGATGISISTTVSAIFNEAMNAATINSSTIELRNPSNALITGAVSYNAATRTATLTPSATLANSTIYTAKVISGPAGVKDAAGNPLASDYSWSFTTAAVTSQPPVSIQSFTTQTGRAATTHSLTGVPAGALLVLATTSDAATSNCSLSSSPSLTWTKRADAGASNSDNSEIWTAVYAAGGSITVTSNWGAVSQASVCYVVLNAEPSLGGTSGTAVSQSAPSVAITTTRANSIIFGCTADWNAVNGTTRTLRDAATERLYFKDSYFTTYYYTKTAASIGAYTEGVSLPTGQQASTALLEIRGASTASARLANPSITTSNSNNSKIYSYSLAQNYPNPFNKVTTLQFTVPKAEKVNLTLFDISGRAVNVLVNGSRDAGTHTVNFNAGSLAKGIYYYRMQAGNFTAVKKLTIR